MLPPVGDKLNNRVWSAAHVTNKGY